MTIRSLMLFLVLTTAACGSSGSDSKVDLGAGPQVSALGSAAPFTFTFKTTTSYNGGIVDLDFREIYSVPLYVKSDGEVSLLAREFPRMVVRICQPSSTDPSCDVLIDDSRVGDGVDLVMDLCGEGIDNADCGPKDGTMYEGSVNADGHLVVTALDVRIRVFLLGGTGPDGHEALVTAGGLLPDLPRLKVVVQTDPDIKTGALIATGSRVKVNSTDLKAEATLVAGGVIPDNMQVLSGAYYTSTMTGTFDVNPLGLLQ